MDVMESKVAVKKTSLSSTCELVIRFLAFLLTLVAAIVIGLNKQTKIVAIKLLSNSPPVNVPATAKWQYQYAFVYHMVGNVIACSYALVSLILLIANKGGKKGLVLTIIVLDLLTVALLSSCNGAATAVGLLGLTGNSHSQWHKVCDGFGKFCGQAAVSIALSLVGSFGFLLLVTFAAWGRQKIPN